MVTLTVVMSIGNNSALLEDAKLNGTVTGSTDTASGEFTTEVTAGRTRPQTSTQTNTEAMPAALTSINRQHNLNFTESITGNEFATSAIPQSITKLTETITKGGIFLMTTSKEKLPSTGTSQQPFVSQTTSPSERDETTHILTFGKFLCCI